MNYIYTLAFIKKGSDILMINRNKQPWKGMWNGVGGKKNKDESPLDCIVREIYEETGILVKKEEVIDKGICTWNADFKSEASGLHLFFVNLNTNYILETPIKMAEGILDWKDINFLLDKDNLGISYNIPYFISNVISDLNRYEYRCLFEGNDLLNVEVIKI